MQAGQLELALDDREPDAAFACRGVFSPAYLKRALLASPPEPEVEQAYKAIQAIWTSRATGLRKGNEAYLRTHFLDRVLPLLGWHFIPEVRSRGFGEGGKRPDYCLFASEEAQQQASETDDDREAVRLSATVLEAKSYNHPLDAASKRESAGLFPYQQIQSYLAWSRDPRGERYFNWAILTNGKRWRLYTERAAPDACFEFCLLPDDQPCRFEDFRLFYALFTPPAFVRRDGGRCQLDDLQQEASQAQIAIEENLKNRVFTVLEDLATAFAAAPANDIAEADFGRLYDASLIFLYRLLFVLYAESRGLLPVRASGLGHNKRYLEKFSLVRLTERLRKSDEFASDAFHELYEQLLALFRLINGDNEAQNDACGVTRYNGGLFSAHAAIDAWRIGDRTLADVLRQLVFFQPPARAGERQLRIRTDETIDYASLHVRQLGDIYEGLLGGHLVREAGRLRLKDESGRNRREGIIYTPDWVVQFLVRETLQPLISAVEHSGPVQQAMAAKSEERARDNSFAYALLRLNLVDPAMGSGHFLVAATEWVAQRIVDHPTTRLMTERIVATGEHRRTRAQIEAEGRIAVSPGIPQYQAEIAYWRRRVVESCIYGVDLNPLAVELAKLALWLTCIAADEPLNFLDHHLRHGNSLLWADPEEMNQLPNSDDDGTKVAELADHLPLTLAAAIRRNVDIESRASTEMKLVKAKEAAWKQAQAELAPIVALADIWTAHLHKPYLTDLQWRDLVRLNTVPDRMDANDRRLAERTAASVASDSAGIRARLAPFHWRLAFPDVFYAEDGSALPPERAGFDAVLGNPPYVSTHTSSGAEWRPMLAARDGYLDDLYVHFTGLGFRILRSGGFFGFIVSDTFFTLASKLRMRELLQNHTTRILGQCDPFDVTVDAAIFVAEKRLAAAEDRLLFIQARPRRDGEGRLTKPEADLPLLSSANLEWQSKAGPPDPPRHAAFRALRLHDVPSALYRRAHKRAFFEPRPGTLALYDRFNGAVTALVGEWWERIATSDAFAENRNAIAAYHATLKPGDVTIVGLIAEGGQGMRTANNARFLGYLEGTPQAAALLAKREEWTRRWLADSRIAPRFTELLHAAGGNPARPLDTSAAWEACVEPLRAEFTAAALGFGKTDLYRIVPRTLVVGEEDFAFAWQRRKQELWDRWRKAPALKDFWTGGADLWEGRHAVDPKAKTIGDRAFCELCPRLHAWLSEQRKAGKRRNPREELGLRSAEMYTDPADAPRIAAIYNGFTGRGVFAPFRKGDPEGNRWTDSEPLYIDWSALSVDWLSTSPLARWQGHRFFFMEGVSWSLHANHVAVKSRVQPSCVFDASGSRLTPTAECFRNAAFLAVLNSDAFSSFLKRFIKHNQDVEINDLRQMPIVIPTPAQARTLTALAQHCLAAKRLALDGQAATQEVTAEARAWSERLVAEAPLYLHPSAQSRTLQSPDDCLAVFELAVHWHAEKLYGVEGQGPFDEF